MSLSLLARLKSAGAIVQVVNDRLRIDAPQKLLTEEILAELKLNKIEIVRQVMLADYRGKLRVAASLTGLRAVLDGFNHKDWTLIERADMSGAYTPHALKLIEMEGVDKWKTLESLAFLCWSSEEQSA